MQTEQLIWRIGSLCSLFILTVAGLLVWHSLTRGQVCYLKLLLDLASAVILGGTRDHILLSQIRDFTFRRLLRLAGLR
jgi:hypothetical protein